ncbi:MAG: hypothetical protein R3C19_20805 [Planctomycetaceae bacterium]
MKRFTSRMDSLRRVRQQTEQLAKMTAARCQADKAAADQHLQAITDQLQMLQADSVASVGGVVTGSLMNTLLVRIEQCRQQLTAAKRQQTDAEQNLQRAVTDYRTARSQRQIVDQLIGRQQAEHRRQQFVGQEHIASELASQRFHLRETEAAQEAKS